MTSVGGSGEEMGGSDVAAVLVVGVGEGLVAGWEFLGVC